MKVLYIDQYFSTHEGVSGTRSYDLAVRLVESGHEVTVLTTTNRYWMPEGHSGGFVHRGRIDGIDVVALGVDYSSLMGRGRRSVSFALFALAGAAVGPFLPGPDVVFASSTPLSVGMPGALISMIRGRPMVFEVRDLWPEAPAALGQIRDGVVLRLLRMLERWIYSKSSRVVALSPGMAEGVRKAGVQSWRISQIPNLCNTELFGADDEMERDAAHYAAGRKVVLYAGAMGPANGLDALPDLAREVKALGGDEVLFVLAGDGPCRPELERRAADESLDNVEFMDPVPRRRMPELFGSCALTLTLFAENPILKTNSPNKLFDSLAAGKPSLVNMSGWTEDLLTAAGAGFRLPTEEPCRAAELLMELLKDDERLKSMGNAARELARGDLNAGKAADRLAGVLQQAIDESAPRPLHQVSKGVLDRAAALAMSIFLSPVLIAIALAIKLDSRGPVLFRLRRAGRYGFPFRPFKFRTMVKDAVHKGAGHNIDEHDERITRVGGLLRRLSLDELPQLADVLLGRMSIVGPRPMLPEQADKLDRLQRRRLAVKPGITGWAQVNGRNAIDWKRRIELDLEYVERFSLWFDLKILWRTIAVVLKGEGLTEDAGTDDPFNVFEEGDD